MSSTDATSGSVDGLAEWLRENQGYDGMGNDPRWEMWADGVERLRAQVARVGAVIDEWAVYVDAWDAVGVPLEPLRAALDGE